MYGAEIKKLISSAFLNFFDVLAIIIESKKKKKRRTTLFCWFYADGFISSDKI